MKKTMILILAMAMLLTACGVNGSSDTQGPAASTDQENSSNQVMSKTNSSISNWNKLSTSWNGKLGVYSAVDSKTISSSGKMGMSSGSSNYFLLTFFDYGKLDGTVLCNKPNCKHDNTSCNAYFPAHNQPKNSCFIFNMDGKMYVILKGIIYSMDEDGTNRKKILQLPSEYIAQSKKVTAFLIGNKIYLETDYITDVKPDKNGNLPADDNGDRTVLFMIDIEKKTYKMLYKFNTQESSEFLGIIGSKAYYIYQDDFTPLKEHTQAELDTQYNDRNTKIFSKDLSGGNRTDLLSGKSYEYDQVVMRGNYLFYQNRKLGEIIRYEPKSGEKKVLVSHIKTYIKFLPMDIMNGQLFYTVDFYDSDFKHKTMTDNETCYVDINSGKNTKIRYRISRDDRMTDAFSGFTKETEDYYILPIKYEIGTVSGGNGYIGYSYIKSTMYGKMRKEDFWNGKYTIQNISWKGDQSLLQ